MRFPGYCEEVGKEALPAGVDTVVTYLAMICAKGLVAAAKRACSSIAHFYRKKFLGVPSPRRA